MSFVNLNTVPDLSHTDYSHDLVDGSLSSDDEESFDEMQPSNHYLLLCIKEYLEVSIGETIKDEDPDEIKVAIKKCCAGEYFEKFKIELSDDSILNGFKYLKETYELVEGIESSSDKRLDIDALIIYFIKLDLSIPLEELSKYLQGIIFTLNDEWIPVEAISKGINEHRQPMVIEAEKHAIQKIEAFISLIGTEESHVPFNSLRDLERELEDLHPLAKMNEEHLRSVFRDRLLHLMPKSSKCFSDSSFNPFYIFKKNLKLNPCVNMDTLVNRICLIHRAYYGRIPEKSQLLSYANFMLNMQKETLPLLDVTDHLVINGIGFERGVKFNEVIAQFNFFTETISFDEKWMASIQLLLFLRVLEINCFLVPENPLFGFITRYCDLCEETAVVWPELKSAPASELCSLIKRLPERVTFCLSEIEDHCETLFSKLNPDSLEYKLLSQEYKNTPPQEDVKKRARLVYTRYCVLNEVSRLLNFLGNDSEQIIQGLLLYKLGIMRSNDPLVVYARIIGTTPAVENGSILMFEEVKDIAECTKTQIAKIHLQRSAHIWTRNPELAFQWLKIFPPLAEDQVIAFEIFRLTDPMASHEEIVGKVSQLLNLDNDRVREFYKVWWYQGKAALDCRLYKKRDEKLSVSDLALQYCCIEIYNEDRDLSIDLQLAKTKALFKQKFKDLLFDKNKAAAFLSAP